jgi:hypothetical protein
MLIGGYFASGGSIFSWRWWVSITVAVTLERLKGSVIRFERPLDSVWDEYFESDERCSEDFMEDRDHPSESDLKDS